MTEQEKILALWYSLADSLNALAEAGIRVHPMGDTILSTAERRPDHTPYPADQPRYRLMMEGGRWHIVDRNYRTVWARRPV